MARKDYFKVSLTDLGDRHLPIVALVGRPNVGKSTLFNRLTRSRRAIIDPTPGMTRDRLYGTIYRDQGSFRLVDTGGIEDSADRIATMIRNQTSQAIEEATVIVLLVDGREGLTAGDEDIAQALRTTGKPVILFVNKYDQGGPLNDPDVFGLGFEQTLSGAAEHNRGIHDLLAAIDGHLAGVWRAPKQLDEETPVLRLAIIGRPNVGKSSIVNKLLNEDRVMVSDIPGTTRDPIDSYLKYNKRNICLVDTAGIRRRGSISGSQESLSVLMAKRQVEQADVIVLLIDASDPSTQQDAAIAGIADKSYKPIVVVVNKWDLVEDKQTNTPKMFEDRIRRRLKFLETSPFVFVSALTGQRVAKVLDHVLTLYDRASKRVTTGRVNRFVAAMAKNYKIPTYRGKAFKIYYMTQVETLPPTFMISVNRKEPLHFTQERFLVNRIREAFDMQGLPIRLIIRPRGRKDGENEGA